MGVFGHENLYSSKYLNAEITDSSNRIHVVHIKRVLGDYFVTKIDGLTFVFRLKPPIYNYHAFFMRTVRKIYYNTANYMPISHADYKKIEQMIDVNGLPELDRTLFDVLHYLGKRERKEFKAHDMKTIFDEIASDKEASKYEQERESMKEFLNHLNIKKIVTPVKEVTEFIQGHLIAPDPQFFGDVLPAYQRLDNEDKLITNKPVRGKKNLIKIIAIMLGVILGGVLIYMLVSSGALSSITNPFEGVGDFMRTQGGAGKPPAISASVPAECQGAPEKCKQAVDLGIVKLGELPASLRSVIEKMPSIAPNSQSINLSP